ncbi:MAG: phosphoglycerate kinase, partial [Rhodobacteraceae bacterium]|nr:phosphoglycerate kinase [Paracoccaceae bacterium]
MGWKTIDDMDFADKTALVRVDINVPVENGQVSDFTRIDAVLPTIRDITEAGGKAVLMAHFGRPKGKVVPEMSLRQILPSLESRLGKPVAFSDDCIGAPAKKAVAAMKPGDVLLLENTRFHPGEEKNDPMMAAALAALGDVYVNDAFSAAHRAHASTEGIARLLPACAGRLMAAELQALDSALGNPARPVVAVVGGAKVSTKLDLLGNLIAKVDALVIGGGMANTFLAAQGKDVGKSLCEHDLADTAREIIAKAHDIGCRLVLPVDLVIAREFKAHAAHEVVTDCPPDAMILDAGPASVAQITDIFKNSRTLIWNGPLGAFELEPFDAATNAAARAAADLTRKGTLVSVAGGGDTVSALNRAGAAADFTYISTAGGAFL